MTFSEQRQRYIVIVLSALGVALLFSLVLESTAAIDNGAVSVGGPLAIFVVIAVLLDRLWKTQSLEAEARKEKLPLFLEESVKVLDLRDAPPNRDPQRAELTDYFLVRRTSEDAVLTSHYASSGAVRVLEKSIPEDRARWRDGPAHVMTDGKKLPDSHVLELDLSRETALTIPVITRLEYINAFRVVPSEGLEAHIDYPTGRFAMIVLMPDGFRCTAATGQVREVRDLVPTRQQPVILFEGRMVHWSVPKPETKAAYSLAWEWGPA